MIVDGDTASTGAARLDTHARPQALGQPPLKGHHIRIDRPGRARPGLRLDPPLDRSEALTALAALPGFGPWTQAYLAMRALADRDALPAADLGLRRAFEAQGLAGDRRSIEARAEAWRPWRAYAVHHLWASEPGPRRAAPQGGP
jgi:AraC family transcriptional regulator of adaptative response / DNA-3-methyladenine glycosylase II